jgi:hypothetical protein
MPKVYDQSMRRLLQLGTFCLFLAAFLAPLAECFDRWDAPGISNDTEFAAFALVLTLCLVLLVSKLLSVLALRIGFVSQPHHQRSQLVRALQGNSPFAIFIPPISPPPLRI